VEQQVMRELVRGKGAHADALACVGGLPPETAGRLVLAFPNSIYGLVWHMAYWMDYEEARIRGEAPPYPGRAAESWPASPAPRDEAEWTQVVARFRSGLATLDRLAALPAPEGERKVALTSGTTNQGDTVKDIVWQTLVHNSYHLGQVVVLRQALGAWPPPTGRDTW
jgi:uncharacterized damage-inducible protein DinB